MAKTGLKADALIVGGGVIGLSVAWELSKRGIHACVVDSGKAGRGASWAGAGILPPAANRNAIDPYEQFQALSHMLHREWASQLLSETGIDTGYQRCGGIYLARSPAESATLRANQGWWETHAIDYETLDAGRLASLEPNLAAICPILRGAWLLPDECQLRNPHHLQALVAACHKAGVRLLEDSEVKEFSWSCDKAVSARLADDRELFADSFCICAGAWTRHFLVQLGHANGIMPVRGQMVLYRCPAPLLSRVVNEGNRYLVPRRDGLLLAGSVEEEVGYVCQTTPEAIEQIRNWAEQILPCLADCKVQDTWAGLRPGSFDSLPYIGQVPNTENLFLAAGHYRSGLHLSCATAQVMANLVTGQPNDIDLAPFRVGRG